MFDFTIKKGKENHKLKTFFKIIVKRTSCCKSLKYISYLKINQQNSNYSFDPISTKEQKNLMCKLS